MAKLIGANSSPQNSSPQNSSPQRGVQSLADPFRQQQPHQRQRQRNQRQFGRLRLTARHLQRGIDRQRQSLGLSRDAGGEGDDGAELAQTRRVGDDAAHQDAGRGQ